VEKVVEARDGRIYIRTSRGGFAEIAGGKAVLVPGSQHPRFSRVLNTMATQILQDRREDWWITTRTRVLRATACATSPSACATSPTTC
jgi:ligand-binding sensor domain-containing protein